MPKHPHNSHNDPIRPGVKWNINLFTLLEVRRMFSLLYYLHILAYPSTFVKHYFYYFFGFSNFSTAS